MTTSPPTSQAIDALGLVDPKQITPGMQFGSWIKEGKEAALAGFSDSMCPYLYNIMARAAWFIGWERGGGNMKTGHCDPLAEQQRKDV